MAKYHGKYVPRPGEHFQTDSATFKNIWKDFEKFENFHPTKNFFKQFYMYFEANFDILASWESKKLIFSKNKNDMKNPSRKILDNDPKYFWVQGFGRLTHTDF